MKKFKEFLTENFKNNWKPLEGKELKKEFDPKGGEIASQLKVYDAGKMKIHPPKEVMEGMRILHDNPDLLTDMLKRPREVWTKERIRKENVLNTEAGEPWDEAKKSLEKEKVERAEKNKGTVQTSPTMIRVKDSNGKIHHWLIGGNTRLSAMDEGDKALVHVFDLTNIKGTKE
jgi:hypothetical protein